MKNNSLRAVRYKAASPFFVPVVFPDPAALDLLRSRLLRCFFIRFGPASLSPRFGRACLPAVFLDPGHRTSGEGSVTAVARLPAALHTLLLQTHTSTANFRARGLAAQTAALWCTSALFAPPATGILASGGLASAVRASHRAVRPRCHPIATAPMAALPLAGARSDAMADSALTAREIKHVSQSVMHVACVKMHIS